jgi:hypothetical protein
VARPRRDDAPGRINSPRLLVVLCVPGAPGPVHCRWQPARRRRHSRSLACWGSFGPGPAFPAAGLGEMYSHCRRTGAFPHRAKMEARFSDCALHLGQERRTSVLKRRVRIVLSMGTGGRVPELRPLSRYHCGRCGCGEPLDGTDAASSSERIRGARCAHAAAFVVLAKEALQRPLSAV